MKLMLLSGGSGKRLWPLSNDSRSKQFLRVLPAPGGGSESMLQRLWRQVGEAGLRESAHILTGRDQAGMIAAQIGAAAPLILEPERRDTFAAILLAAAYAAGLPGAAPDETVVIMPIDPCVDGDFFRTLALLDSALAASRYPLVLVGVHPTHPSEKYGYIVIDEHAGEHTGGHTGPLRTVSRFTEKPSAAEAARLIGEGALWNCGVFAGRLSFYTGLLAERGLPADYAGLLRRYAGLPKISFDYEVAERLSSLAVLPYEGRWKDLGTWNTLTEEMRETVSGPGTVSADSIGTHIVNELDIPVKVLGASGLIVAASPDGILVADKEASPRIKEMLNEDAPPMYAERQWGWQRVLERGGSEEDRRATISRIAVHAGCTLPLRCEAQCEYVWVVTSGSGEAVLEKRVHPLGPGDALRLPPGMPHSLRTQGGIRLVETAFPL